MESTIVLIGSGSLLCISQNKLYAGFSFIIKSLNSWGGFLLGRH